MRMAWPIGGMMCAGLVLGAVVAGCSSKTAEKEGAAAAASSGPRVADVGKVTVSLASAIDADNQKILQEVNAVSRLQVAIEGELKKAGKFKPGSPRTLDVQVSEFRLRSGATVFWAGVMAGVDTLQVKASVREAGKVVRQFNTGDSSTGAFGGLTSSSRFQPMADTTAERLAQAL